MDANCGNCHYRSIGGICHRYPPQSFVEYPSANTSEVIYSTWRQPYVDKDEWCGEHQLKDGT